MKICHTCHQTYSDDVEFCARDGARLAAQGTETEAQLAAGLSRRFRLVRRLGAGGMGTVFLAEQIGVGNRPVALKVLNRKLLDDPDFLLRFQNEAGSTGRIRHVNVVTIFESAQADDGTPYIAMEFLDGESLRQALQRRGALPVAEVAEILQQSARGLNAAHKLGIIHRDLKPDNIFLTQGDENELIVKVVDFGIAKLRESAMHTQTGMVLGTPAYMSCEQASGMRSDELDARSDIYSLGVVVYEMLSGRVPFHSDTPLGYLRKHMLEPPPPLRAVAPGLPVPGGLEAVVMKALTKNRDERYATALEFARDFARAASAPGQIEASALGPTQVVDTGDRERAEQERLTHEKAAAEQAAREKAHQEQLAREKADAKRREAEPARTQVGTRQAESVVSPSISRTPLKSLWRRTGRFSIRLAFILMTYYPLLWLVLTYLPGGFFKDKSLLWGHLYVWIRDWGHAPLWFRDWRYTRKLPGGIWVLAWSVVPFCLAIVGALLWPLARLVGRWRGEPVLRPDPGRAAILAMRLAAIFVVVDVAILAVPFVPSFARNWRQVAPYDAAPLALTLAAALWAVVWGLRARQSGGGQSTSASEALLALRPHLLSTLKWLAAAFLALAAVAGGWRFRWAMDTHAERTLANYPAIVESLAFSPYGRTLVSGGYGTVDLWDVVSGRKIKAIDLPDLYPVWSEAFSLDGKLIAIAGQAGMREILDSSSGQVVRALDVHDPTNALCAAFSPDGRLVATDSYRLWIRVWDVASGHLVKILSGHDQRIVSFAFSPDGRLIAMAGRGGLREIRELATGRLVRRLDPSDETDAKTVAFSPDGQLVGADSYGGAIRLWETASGRLVQILSGQSHYIICFAFSHDGRILAAAEDNEIKLWDVASGHEIHTLTGHSGEVTSLAFSPYGNHLASGSLDTDIMLWRW